MKKFNIVVFDERVAYHESDYVVKSSIFTRVKFEIRSLKSIDECHNYQFISAQIKYWSTCDEYFTCANVHRNVKANGDNDMIKKLF